MHGNAWQIAQGMQIFPSSVLKLNLSGPVKFCRSDI